MSNIKNLQENQSVNFIITYTTLRSLGGPEERKVEIPFHGLTLEEKKALNSIEGRILLDWEPFQEELLQAFRNNGYSVEIPSDWQAGFFDSSQKDGSIFDIDIQLNDISVDLNYDEKLLHQRKAFKKIFGKYLG